MIDFARRTTAAPKVLPFRLSRAILGQKSRTPRCPDTPRLDGKVAVVTGGNAGIGLEIARGLAKRGAEVVIAARTRATAEKAVKEIASETGANVRDVALDLSDLASVNAAAEALPKTDILVANAGIWPTAYATSKQGHEIAFATNTLGHHVLVKRMLHANKLQSGARIVVLTGDIYIRQNECTPDFTYEGKSGGGLAYCRSKLGNLWFATELQRRNPELEVCSVHPGVVTSNLGGGGAVTGFAAFMRGVMLIDCEAGAQTPLWCATQPIERGGYYHNTLGRVIHPSGDPAADPEKAKAMWDRLEALSS